MTCLILGLWVGSGMLALFIRWRTEGLFGIIFNNLKQRLTAAGENPLFLFTREHMAAHVRNLEEQEEKLWEKATRADRTPRLRDMYPWPMVLLMTAFLILAHVLYGPFTAPPLLNRPRLVRPTPN